MGARRDKKEGLTVALTGATGDLGGLLLPRLLDDSGVARVIALDLAKPSVVHEKLTYRRVDLTQDGAEGTLSDILEELNVDALYHLALLLGPRRHHVRAHELEVIGTMRLLAATARAKPARLIVASLTVVYGAHRDNPALMGEASEPRGMKDSRFVSDKVELDGQALAFIESNPEAQVLLLRLAPPLGPNSDNPASRFLSRRFAPTFLGFDPLWQVLHEEDAAEALHRALRAPGRGVFNVVSALPLPLSSLLRAAGSMPLPLPGPVARGLLSVLNSFGSRGLPHRMLDFLTVSWVADGEKAKTGLGFEPRYSAADAAKTLRHR